MQFMHDKTALANRRLRKEEHNLPQRALRADHLQPAIPGSSLPSGPPWWIQPRRSDGPSSVNSKDINQSDDTKDNVDSQVTATEASFERYLNAKLKVSDGGAFRATIDDVEAAIAESYAAGIKSPRSVQGPAWAASVCQPGPA